MHILIIAPYYSPDLGPSAPLFTMLASSLKSHGHGVTVLTAVPHYPSGQVASQYRGKWVFRSVENGVNVIRVGLPSIKRSNLAFRSLQYIVYQFLAVMAGLNLCYEAVIVANPALWTWLPFVYYVVMKRKPAIFSVHDVYPDVGIRLGIFHHNVVISLVASLEKYCLKHASIVRILSEGFKPGLGRLGVAEEKMALVYDWVDTDLIRPISRENHFAQAQGLNGRFRVVYAGNMGLSQGLELVLEAAERLADHADIQFIFVGDGSAHANLVSIADQRGLDNVLFIPFQPREILPDVLASADVSLIVLKKGIGIDSLPSKTFSILASGRPAIACVDENSETRKLIEKAKAGRWTPPEDPIALVAAILELQQNNDLRLDLGRNGRAWSAVHHSPDSAAWQFESLLQKIIVGDRPKNLPHG